MKNLINCSIYFLMISLIIGCNLEEEPPFLDENLYQDVQSAQAARDGIYQSLTTYNTQRIPDSLCFPMWHVYTCWLK